MKVQTVQPVRSFFTPTTLSGNRKDATAAYRNEDGSIIAVGYKGGAYDDESFIVTSAQAFMMKIDADLTTVLWEKDIPEFMQLRRVVKAKDGSGLCCGGQYDARGLRVLTLADVLHPRPGRKRQCAAGEFQACWRRRLRHGR